MADDFAPNWTTHPAEHIEEYIELSGMTPDEWSDKHGFDAEYVKRLLRKKARVTPDIAEQLEKVTMMKAYIWLGIQHDYDKREGA